MSRLGLCLLYLIILGNVPYIPLRVALEVVEALLLHLVVVTVQYLNIVLAERQHLLGLIVEYH